MHLTDAGRDAARRGQAILDEPPTELTGLGASDLIRLDEILARLQQSSLAELAAAMLLVDGRIIGAPRRKLGSKGS